MCGLYHADCQAHCVRKAERCNETWKAVLNDVHYRYPIRTSYHGGVPGDHVREYLSNSKTKRQALVKQNLSQCSPLFA